MDCRQRLGTVPAFLSRTPELSGLRTYTGPSPHSFSGRLFTLHVTRRESSLRKILVQLRR